MLKFKIEAGLVRDKQAIILSNVCKIFIARLQSRSICIVCLPSSESVLHLTYNQMPYNSTLMIY